MMAARRFGVIRAITLAAGAGLAGFASVPIAAQTHANAFPGEPELARYNLHTVWRTQVPNLKNREKVLSLRVIGDVLFAASDQGLLHCLDANTGALQWSATVAPEQGTVFPPALNKDTVFVCASNKVTALARKGGGVLWTEQLSSLATSGPAADERYVMVQTADERITAISLKPDDFGETSRWPYKRVFNKHPALWSYNAGAPLENLPILLADRVIFAADDGIVYAAAVRTGQIRYRYYTHSTLAAPLAYLDRRLYVATSEYNIFAIDMINGETVWKHILGYPVIEKPLPFLDDVFVATEGAGVFCLDNKTGERRWQNAEGRHIMAVSKDHVYSFADPDRMIVLSRKDGKRLASFSVGDFTVTSENQHTDRVFLSSASGLILGLGELANKEPFHHPQEVPSPIQTEKTPTKKETKSEDNFFDIPDKDKEEPKPKAVPKAKPKAETKEKKAVEKKVKKARSSSRPRRTPRQPSAAGS